MENEVRIESVKLKVRHKCVPKREQIRFNLNPYTPALPNRFCIGATYRDTFTKLYNYYHPSDVADALHGLHSRQSNETAARLRVSNTEIGKAMCSMQKEMLSRLNSLALILDSTLQFTGEL